MENIIETEHGIITQNTTEWWLSKYTTYRERQKHYFQKYNGYGISTTELDLIKKFRCTKIIFRIKEEEGKISIYKITTEQLEIEIKNFQKYNYMGDQQVIIPIDALTKVAEDIC